MELGNQWVLSYKYERLTLNKDFDKDRFIRHGLGVRYQFHSNANVLLKYERADVGRVDLNQDSLRAAEDAVLGIFRVWL